MTVKLVNKYKKALLIRLILRGFLSLPNSQSSTCGYCRTRKSNYYLNDGTSTQHCTSHWWV